MKSFTLHVSILSAALAGLAALRNRAPAFADTVRITHSKGATKLEHGDTRSHLSYLLDPGQPATKLGQKLAQQRYDREDCSFLAPIQQLRKICNAADRDCQILVQVDTKIEVHYTVAAAPLRQVLTVQRPGSFPDAKDLQETPEPGMLLDPSITRTIRAAFTFASDQETRAAICGVHLDITNKKCHAIVSTDGRRLFHSNSITLPLQKSVTVPAIPLLKGQLFDGPWAMGLQGEVLTIACGRWKLSTRLDNLTFPAYRQAMGMADPKNMAARFTLTEESTRQLPAVLKSLPDPSGSHAVNLCTSKNGITLAGRRPASKDRKTPLELLSPVHFILPCAGKEVGTIVSRVYLAEAIQAGFRTFEIPEDTLTPIVGRDQARTMIIMPMLEEPRTAAA